MKRRLAVAGVVAVAALAALGGCSKKAGSDQTVNVTIGKPAAAPAASGAMPERKAGLWEQTMSSDRIHQTSKICIDKATGAKMNLSGQQMGRSNCETSKVTGRLGGGWEFNSSCDLGAGGHVVTHGVASGDMGDHYTVDIDSTTTGSSMPQANGVHKMKLEMAYKGACPEGMKPGDIELAGGMRFNPADAAAGKGPGGLDMAKLRAQAMSGHMDPAEMAKLKAQAKAMEAAAKQSQ
jgi:hypothetical protein